MTPGLTLRGLSKRFDERMVIQPLDLTVNHAELLVLVGPSGSGKSTLLRLIAGLIKHDEGEIMVGGVNVGNLPADRRDIAMVFQSYALFPHLSVRDNLAFGMHARREPMAEGRIRIDDVARQLQLTDLLDRYPRQISGGERQRVALARALLRKPKLFLLDEPLSNLDAQLRVHTRAEILKLHRQLKTTMVLVTHDQIEALSVGDRIGVLRDGKLEDLGTPKDLYDYPRTEFVASFLGSPAMNMFDAEISNGTLRFCGIEMETPVADYQGSARVGIRPEHIGVDGSGWTTRHANTRNFKAELEVIEFVGDQCYLQFDWSGQTLIARTEPDHPAHVGEMVECWLDPARLHLFGMDGQRLGAMKRMSA